MIKYTLVKIVHNSTSMGSRKVNPGIPLSFSIALSLRA
jgi:hypothetical protein